MQSLTEAKSSLAAQGSLAATSEEGEKKAAEIKSELEVSKIRTVMLNTFCRLSLGQHCNQLWPLAHATRAELVMCTAYRPVRLTYAVNVC